TSRRHGSLYPYRLPALSDCARRLGENFRSTSPPPIPKRCPTNRKLRTDWRLVSWSQLAQRRLDTQNSDRVCRSAPAPPTADRCPTDIFAHLRRARLFPTPLLSA